MCRIWDRVALVPLCLAVFFAAHSSRYLDITSIAAPSLLIIQCSEGLVRQAPGSYPRGVRYHSVSSNDLWGHVPFVSGPSGAWLLHLAHHTGCVELSFYFSCWIWT